MLLRHANATDVGRVRDHNEDTFEIHNGDGQAAGGALFVVCDGMGGYTRGEVASHIAATTITARYMAQPDADASGVLRTAFGLANEEVLSQGDGEMGTTAIAAIVRHNVAVVANVGDCRAYMVRDGKQRQITRDHSFVAEQVAAGILTAEQAKESSYRNIVTRAIGSRDELEVDVYREPLAVGDVVVLCSDGLHGQVEATEIALAFSKVSLQSACTKLVALANKRGGPDNITIVAFQVEALDEDVGASSTGEPAATPRSPTEPVNVVATPASTLATTTPATTTPATTTPATAAPVTTAPATGTPRSLVAPPLARPAASGGRGLMLWFSTLLLVAALSFGGYLIWRAQPRVAPNTPVTVPTLTPLGTTSTTAPVLLPPLSTDTAVPAETMPFTITAVASDTIPFTGTSILTSPTNISETMTPVP